MDVGQHYQHLFTTAAGSFTFSATTAPALAQWQQEFRAHLRGLLGLTRMDVELRSYQPRAEHIDTQAQDGYLRQQWLLWPEPTLCLPFYLLRPQRPAARSPLVLTPHGHNPPQMYVGLCESESERQMSSPAIATSPCRPSARATPSSPPPPAASATPALPLIARRTSSPPAACS